MRSESSLLICCGGRGRTQNSISVSVEVEVEGRAERRAAAFLLCCWLPPSPAASVMCVSFPLLEFSGPVSCVASRRAAVQILLYVYVRGRVGRPTLPPSGGRKSFRVGRRLFFKQNTGHTHNTHTTRTTTQPNTRTKHTTKQTT